MSLLKSKPTLSLIKMEGIEFYVINHSGGRTKLLAKDFYGRGNFSRTTKPSFDPSDPESDAAYRLNGSYYNSLPQNLKNSIIETVWNIYGSQNFTAKVGLLSLDDWNLIKANANTLYQNNLVFWLLTVSDWNYSIMYTASVNSFGEPITGTSARAAIESEYYRPVIHVSSNLELNDNDEVIFNQDPTITPSTTPSGTYSNKPSFEYTVFDADGDLMSITEKIDGITFNTHTNVASGTKLTYTPTDLAWLRTRINQTINIEITADDGNGGVTTVTYPITRTTPAIDLQLKNPFETDVRARRILLSLDGQLPSAANITIEACNNAFDDNPTWENITHLALQGFPYPFNNENKTAANWGVSFRVRIERGNETGPIYLDGIGGAFD